MSLIINRISIGSKKHFNQNTGEETYTEDNGSVFCMVEDSNSMLQFKGKQVTRNIFESFIVENKLELDLQDKYTVSGCGVIKPVNSKGLPNKNAGKHYVTFNVIKPSNPVTIEVADFLVK